MSALTPIDQVIRQNCLETGDPACKNYDTILSHVRGAIVDLQLFVMPNVKVEYVGLNSLKNISWPKDCIQILEVELERNKRSCTLSVSTDIQPIEDCGCTSESEVAEVIDEVCNGCSDYSKGFDSLKICVHNKETRTTHVRGKLQSGDKLKITYSSDGISDGVKFVPIEAEKAISEFVFWKYFRRTDKGTSDRAQINYERFSYQLRTLYQDRSLADWLEVLIKP